MARMEWTLSASEDVDDIYDYIAWRDRRPETAEKVIAELRDCCQKYAEAFATGNIIGTDRSDLDENIRLFTFKRWVVLFLPLADGIEVVRIVDGSRDFSQLFGR